MARFCCCEAGPGGVLPLSLGDGDLLVGGAAGDWHAGQNLPAPGGVGQVPFWDGGVPGRYRYSAPPADGDTWYFNATTGLWVPRAPLRSAVFSWGDTATANLTTFVYKGWVVGTSPGIESQAGMWIAPYDGILETFHVWHLNPVAGGNITYTVRTGATPGTMANTAMAVVLGSAANTGSDLATSLPLTQGTLVSLQNAQNTGGALNVRVSAIVTFRETP